MTWLYFVVIIFSALTVYFVHGAYQRGCFSEKIYTFVSIMEAIVIVAAAVMLIRSL